MFNSKKQNINDVIKKVHSTKDMLICCNDEYNIGMYNGMEYVLSIIENRKPGYLVNAQKEKSEEKEEESKRTVSRGVKRR